MPLGGDDGREEQAGQHAELRGPWKPLLLAREQKAESPRGARHPDRWKPDTHPYPRKALKPKALFDTERNKKFLQGQRHHEAIAERNLISVPFWTRAGHFK